MSDGNFNRSMLPYRDYQSGLRAGKAQMRTIAVEAFKFWLSKHPSALDAENFCEAVADFKQRLEK